MAAEPLPFPVEADETLPPGVIKFMACGKAWVVTLSEKPVLIAEWPEQ